ncbi:MAG: hypothetical protein P0Y52_10075 [Candidatus Brevundimonas phytovorans]|nr:hypothetical protein [Brevundimonas sp.]WEK56892.1 MAG: hypothetical protein P0Y52_10075 [Brevundimonas sp.]
MFPAFVKRLLIFATLAAVFAATPSAALLVQPVFLDMRYSGVLSNAGVRVVNDRNRPVSVEVTVSSVDVPESGDAVFTPIEGEDFLIFPAVANIPANGAQIFRVRWIGDPAKAEGQIFAFTTSELPLEIDGDPSAAVQLLYAIQTIVGIGPVNARAEIEAVSVERVSRPNGDKGVMITFQNNGELHGQVSAATLTLATPGWSHQFTPADMSAAVGLGLVPAQRRRAMFLAVPDLPDSGAITVTADVPRVTGN